MQPEIENVNVVLLQARYKKLLWVSEKRKLTHLCSQASQNDDSVTTWTIQTCKKNMSDINTRIRTRVPKIAAALPAGIMPPRCWIKNHSCHNENNWTLFWYKCIRIRREWICSQHLPKLKLAVCQSYPVAQISSEEHTASAAPRELRIMKKMIQNG